MMMMYYFLILENSTYGTYFFLVFFVIIFYRYYFLWKNINERLFESQSVESSQSRRYENRVVNNYHSPTSRF